MLVCWSCAATFASCLKRFSRSSSEDVEAARPSSRMVLIATMRPSSLSFALYTVPMAPAPSFFSIW